MNFLAHIYLSGGLNEVMIGNFIADAVKGNQVNDFPEPVRKGIILHRKIDFFTDNHPVVRKSKYRLREKYGKYSPVVVDIFYDHFLARNWENYSEIPLPEFAVRVYRLLQNHIHGLPEKVKILLPYMIQGNWLANYASMEGINRTLSGMSQRARFQSGIENAGEDLREYYSSFEREFFEFFPEVKALSEDFLAKRS